jgi:hypothetical protein
MLQHAKYEIPENGQQLRPKHVGALINKLKTAVQHVGIKCYTGCPRRNVKYLGRVFLMLNYTDITQNTYIQN